MADIIQRLSSLLSANVGTVGTSAVQISGGPQANWPLTAVAATFYPNYHRMAMRIANNSNNILYIGSTNAVTAASGWFKKLNPGEFFDDMIGGAVPRWVIASAVSSSFTLEEYQ